MLKYKISLLVAGALSLGGCKEKEVVLPTPTPAPKAFEKIYYPGESDFHQTGARRDDKSWEANVNHTNSRFLTYGPYATDIPSGSGTATFRLALDNVSADKLSILELDVFDANRSQVLAKRTLKRTDFSEAQRDEDFSVSFFSEPGASLEFRVFWKGYSYIRHSRTQVRAAFNSVFSTDSMEDFWNGLAHFQFVRRLDWPPYESSGWIAVRDGHWYLFNRQTNYEDKPSYCAGLDYARTVVRQSSDQGKTWSDPVIAAEQKVDDPHSNCAVLDGSTFFDEDNQTWHLLAQCLGQSAGWRLCHYTRNDRSPVGPFSPDPQNPVVEPGALWRSICEGNLKSCPTSTFDEGTPDILYKKDGYFTVTFHGYDAGPRTGYRGAAKTRDFRNWVTIDSDLPNDALFSSQDCDSWNPGCIGGGESTSLITNRYHYLLIEAPDKGLGCTEDQYWVFGLMRATRLEHSGRWESFARNPLMTPSHRRACGLQYARFIKDPTGIFMMYEDGEKGRRLFRLVPGAGIPLVE